MSARESHAPTAVAAGIEAVRRTVLTAIRQLAAVEATLDDDESGLSTQLEEAREFLEYADNYLTADPRMEACPILALKGGGRRGAHP
ncbi:MAG: hypothetical protein JWP44_4895 [Mucilaginibacter sp.]|nr:hypothetical protein [Mucilaginibacter sp.]